MRRLNIRVVRWLSLVTKTGAPGHYPHVMELKTDNQSIQDALKRLSRNRSPGVAYSYFKGGKEYNFAHGLADIISRRPVDEDTTFSLYSVTKTFTATAIFQLQEKNKLEIDSPVASVIDDYPFADDIRISHLLSHISGLPNPVPLAWTHLPDEHAAFDYSGFTDGIIGKYANLRLDPERKYAYSNVGYLLLGKIIEKAAGEDYHTYVRKNILDKLKIPRKDLDFEPENPENKATGYQNRLTLSNLLLGLFMDKKKFTSRPAGKKWKPFKPLFVNGPSYGGLMGNGRGIGIFLRDMLSKKPILLTRSSVNHMLTPQKTASGKYTGTSLGWFSGNFKENEYFCHAGGGGGFYSEIRIYPERNVTSAIFFNGSGMSDERILDRMDRRIL